MKIRKIHVISKLIFLALISLTGCDRIQQQISDVLNTPNPAEMSRRMDAMVRLQKYQEAIAIGEQYLNKNQDPENLVTIAITSAYIESGDAAGAVRHMQRTAKSSVSSNPSAATAASSTESVAVDGASVTETTNGIVVKAGDAVVIIPK